MKHITLLCHSHMLLVGILLVLFTGVAFADPPTSSGFTLSTSDYTDWFYVNDNTGSPLLRDFGDGAFCLGGHFAAPYGVGGTIPPVAGAGARLMWCPGRAAFRVGYVDGTQWDAANIGPLSIAIGYNTTAEGYGATAIGAYASSGGSSSIAIHGTASAESSVAIGGTASGESSMALTGGNASGMHSIAIGSFTTASGDYSIAMGYRASTNGYEGSFIIGDHAPFGPMTLLSSTDNEMTMRFAGGYRFYTKSDLSISACLLPGSSSWVTCSDSTKKEKYLTANGEQFLIGLSHLRLGSWNYKGQDAKYFRHYGPMAQEIFRYFGKDNIGIIGNDTSLATADMDGIMMICLQALENRTSELQKSNQKIALMEQQNIERDKTILALSEKIEKLTQLLSSSTTINQSQFTTNITKEEQR